MHRIESNRPGGQKGGQKLFLDPCFQSATGVEGVADGYTVWLGLASTVRAWGQPKGTGQGPEKTPEPFSLGQGAD
jgi:hypothetical protein